MSMKTNRITQSLGRGRHHDKETAILANFFNFPYEMKFVDRRRQFQKNLDFSLCEKALGESL